MNSLDLRDAIATTMKLARSAAPAAALATSLLSPSASSAPGDLDPSFADVGRAYPLPGLEGPAWSVQPQGDDDFILAGGDYYSYYETSVSGFTHRVSSNGSLDQAFAALKLADTQVMDVAVQADGRVIGVGRTLRGPSAHFMLTVFRLDSDGALDPTFGVDGIAHLGTGQELDPDMAATSVVLDSNGRFVVAGVRGAFPGVLTVARFLENGTLDTTFGVDGVFTGGPVTLAYGSRPQILRTGDGRFRIATTLRVPSSAQPGVFRETCHVLGLTADGAVDVAFGNSGSAALPGTGSTASTCSALAAQPDGKLLVAGSNADHGMLVRLVAGGAKDDSFSAPAIADRMVDATALGVDSNGSILVAGLGPPEVTGALVVRLQANGLLDTLFGNGGSTWVDLPSNGVTYPRVRDLTVLPGDGAMLAGADRDDIYYLISKPFVARLLGTRGGDGPGVLGVERRELTVTEQGANAVITVRRMGGKSGQVSVAYTTQAGTGSPDMATPGQDYTSLAGRLTWADGDASNKQVTVPIVSDTSLEGPEFFSVALDDAQGGAGLGTSSTVVRIPADPGFLGVVSITQNPAIVVVEKDKFALVSLILQTTAPGGASVKLTMNAGTAIPRSDYVDTPITVSWSEGSGLKTIRVPIVDDGRHEPEESFTVTLADPSDGIVLGEQKTATITIQDDDESAGGGAFGFASWLLLAAAGVLRYRRRLGIWWAVMGSNHRPTG